MKRKLLFGIVIMAIAALAAWNVNYGSQTKGMSNLSLANVEALAVPESGEAGVKYCRQASSPSSGSSPCGYGGIKMYWSGTNYSCELGDGSNCKSGFVGSTTTCAGHTTTTTESDLSTYCI